MRLVFRADAAEDAFLAHDWYEDQRAGLGTEFAEALGHAVDRIRDMPDSFPEIRHGVRRALLRRFPYAVYYRRRDDLIEVIACLHMRRDEAPWRDSG